MFVIPHVFKVPVSVMTLVHVLLVTLGQVVTHLVSSKHLDKCYNHPLLLIVCLCSV